MGSLIDRMGSLSFYSKTRSAANSDTTGKDGKLRPPALSDGSDSELSIYSIEFAAVHSGSSDHMNQLRFCNELTLGKTIRLGDDQFTDANFKGGAEFGLGDPAAYWPDEPSCSSRTME